MKGWYGKLTTLGSGQRMLMLSPFLHNITSLRICLTILNLKKKKQKKRVRKFRSAFGERGNGKGRDKCKRNMWAVESLTKKYNESKKGTLTLFTPMNVIALSLSSFIFF